MKKKVLIGFIIIVLVILLFPRRNALNDGGTIEYKAVVYKVSKVHRYKIDGKYNNNFENGIIIELFGKEIYNNVEWIFRKNLFSFFFLVLIFLTIHIISFTLRNLWIMEEIYILLCYFTIYLIILAIGFD